MKCKRCKKAEMLLDRIYKHWCELSAAMFPEDGRIDKTKFNIKFAWLDADMSDVRDFVKKGDDGK